MRSLRAPHMSRMSAVSFVLPESTTRWATEQAFSRWSLSLRRRSQRGSMCHPLQVRSLCRPYLVRMERQEKRESHGSNRSQGHKSAEEKQEASNQPSKSPRSSLSMSSGGEKGRRKLPARMRWRDRECKMQRVFLPRILWSPRVQRRRDDDPRSSLRWASLSLVPEETREELLLS
mmetsp:Transcript_43311/g.112599  ORF Transcript_43311/g.112599 Transcript_43311/m.112599 type:complete len:175 (+) Transcript_43311:1292-1816(+)